MVSPPCGDEMPIRAKPPCGGFFGGFPVAPRSVSEADSAPLGVAPPNSVSPVDINMLLKYQQRKEKPALAAGFSRHHYHLLLVGGVSSEMEIDGGARVGWGMRRRSVLGFAGSRVFISSAGVSPLL